MTSVVPEKPRIAIIGSSATQTNLSRLIAEAEQRLFLVSPYVQFDKLRKLVREVQGALAKGVSVTLALRAMDFSTGKKDPLDSDALTLLRQANMKVLLVKDLHAKVYISEKNALLTSLNLLESSINNSIEIGTWISSGTTEYAAVEAFLKSEILPTAQVVPPLSAPAEKTSEPQAPKREPRAAPAREARTPLQVVVHDGPGMGHCIRCRDELEFNMERPLCRGCFISWKKYEDKNYAEKYCHDCGEPKKTSMARPLCRPCFEALPPASDDDIVF